MPARTSEAPGTDRAFTFRAIGLGTVLIAALVRVCVAIEPIPYWDGDPTVLYTPSVALGPYGSLILDTLTLLGAAIGILASANRPGPGVRGWACGFGLVLCGVVAVAWHSFWNGGGNLDDLRIGADWAAAFVGGLAAWRLCSEPALRRITLAALIGVVGLLCAKGAGQLLIEHPATLAMYRQTKDQFLQSQGWSADSASARAFERRLEQPEATGWFGLSNVYASVAATALVACVGTILRSWRACPAWARAVLAVGTSAALAALAMSKSKGGITAAGLGVALAVVLRVTRARVAQLAPTVAPRIGGMLAVGAVIGALGAVVARGLLGTRLGELSLLFRWFYMQGAARIFAGHWFTGVGPAGFKDAYLLAKPPISPEEVSSPHSLLWDLSATLGLGGVALGAVWIAWVWGAGRRLIDPNTLDSNIDRREPWSWRVEARLLTLILAVPVLVGSVVESPAGTFDAALVRILGLAASAALAIGLSAAWRSTASAWTAAIPAAVALAAHAQIEVTPIWAGTACWFMLLFGAMAAPNMDLSTPEKTPSRSSPASRVAPRVVATVLFGLAAALWIFGTYRVGTWQSHLVDAANRYQIPAGGILDEPPSLDAVLPASLDDLVMSSAAVPTHAPTLRAASKVSLQLAMQLQSLKNDNAARAAADHAEELALCATKASHERAQSWGWLGTLRRARAANLGDRSALSRAAEAWEVQTTLDPYGLISPAQLATTYADLGRADDARRWARKAIDLNRLITLDPLKGLTDDQVRTLRRLADGL